MKIIKIKGGLGNQMFQFAFYLSVKNKYQNDIVKIDTSFYDNNKAHNGYELKKIFSVNADYAVKKEIEKLTNSRNNFITKVIRKLFGGRKTDYIEKNFLYDKTVYSFNNKDKYFDGYWQNPKYFSDIKNIINSYFVFDKNLKDENYKILRDIIEQNSVSLHIRRGDYINNFKAKNLHGGICTLKYYHKAISVVKEYMENPYFFVFSDDIDWVKNNLEIDNNVKYIDWNRGSDSYRDMQLMSNCKHNIIANSSFSWWGTWLNENRNKIVISPNKWFNNREIDNDVMIMDNWIKINSNGDICE
jgi:hypothetical protein